MDPQEKKANIINDFRKLRASIYNILPSECLLRYHNLLNKHMIIMLNTNMINRGLVSREDICLCCSKEECPYNNVSHKFLRYIKIRLLGFIFHTSFCNFLKRITR